MGILQTVIRLPCLVPLHTALKSLQLQKQQSVCPSMCKSHQICPTVQCAQEVSSAHSCKKRTLAHITQNTCTVHQVHCRFVRGAQVHADLMLGRGETVGAGGLRGITLGYPYTPTIRGITPTNHTGCPCHTPSHPSRQNLTPIILVNNTQAFANISKSSS